MLSSNLAYSVVSLVGVYGNVTASPLKLLSSYQPQKYIPSFVVSGEVETDSI